MKRVVPIPYLRATLAGGALALLLTFGLTACTPTPTPEPTATVEPTDVPTALPPPSTATPRPTATEPATATSTSEPTVVPTEPQAAAPPQPTAVPPSPAPTYEVKWWADQAHMPKDLGCTSINWEVTGAKEVYLRWPDQDENLVEHAGRQEGVCLKEGERAVFTLRVVKPDGSNDIREMKLERDG